LSTTSNTRLRFDESNFITSQNPFLAHWFYYQSF
jgi:hypothetical protein